MTSKIKDLKNVARRESYFSTLAKKEGKEALKRAKQEKSKGMKESAKDSRREARIDKTFSNIRKRIAIKAKNKLRKEK